ncbi:MAG: porin family protein [Sphingomonas sp.]|jgi:outer membrane immunogenic protein|nr:MAG: porin family protein [Sphingomonas sp.]
MRKTYFLAAASAALVSFGAPAIAQDMDDKPFDGVYIGGTVGFDAQPNDVGSSILFDRTGDGRFGDTVTTPAGGNAFSPGFCNGAARSSANANCRNDKDNISYSARVGFDKQFGNIVVGAIGEFGKSEVRDSVSGFSTTPASYTMTREVDYNANIRARAGYALDRTLFYGTGGVAYAKINSTFETSNTANAFAAGGDDDAWGFVAGGGVEQKLGKHFSVGLEYLYNQYKDDGARVRVTQGSAPATNPFVLAPNTAGTDFRRSDDKFRWHSVRATAQFRF